MLQILGKGEGVKFFIFVLTLSVYIGSSNLSNGKFFTFENYHPIFIHITVYLNISCLNVKDDIFLTLAFSFVNNVVSAIAIFICVLIARLGYKRGAKQLNSYFLYRLSRHWWEATVNLHMFGSRCISLLNWSSYYITKVLFFKQNTSFLLWVWIVCVCVWKYIKKNTCVTNLLQKIKYNITIFT